MAGPEGRGRRRGERRRRLILVVLVGPVWALAVLAVSGAADASAPPVTAPVVATAARPPEAAAGRPPPDPDEARRQAHDILQEKRFRRSRPPRPLRGVLRWIGDRIRPVTDAVDRFFRTLGDHPVVAWAAGAVLLAVLALSVVAALRRRERARVLRPSGDANRGRAARVDPGALEAEAARAEAEGRLEEAIRLRFRAGLARLYMAGVLPAGLIEPNGEIARELSSARFDALSGTFDEVVYGRRPPSAADAEEARRGWPAVVAEVTR